jgi:hypothetical protein
MSTYEPIATQTLGSAAASVTFSSIPQGYTDLVIVQSSQTSAGGYTRITFNSDTGSNYSNTQMYGSGTTAGTSRTSSLSYMQTGYNTASVQVGHIYQIMNYSNATTYKTALTRWNDTSDTVGASVGLWRNTNAITSITLTQGSGNYNTGSTFSIYGIQVGQAAQKAQGGNIVTTDGTYVYHTFTSSGSFIPSQALTADYLVVAGGGGGGLGTGAGDYGAGGGAGGMRCTVTATGGGGSLESALSLSSGKSYPVIVGAGGAAQISTGLAGNNGNNSVFATITSTAGGGGAGGTSGQTGKNGGSGGGGGNGGIPGTGTANQGFAGGANPGSGYAAGGGGAGAVGSSSAAQNVAGGSGVATSISGSSLTYAIGGNGGVVSPSDGTTNTGNGGGGKTSTGTSGAGGSGIVIIRYLA